MSRENGAEEGMDVGVPYDETENRRGIFKQDVVVRTIAGSDIRRAAEEEHGRSLFDELKLYPRAAAWSMFFSLGIIMAAFEAQVLGNLYATPAFQRDFGYLFNGSYIIAASWQTALSMGNPIGQVVGAFCAAYPMEWYGRKKTFGACVVLTASFIFIQFFARNLETLFVGELLGGLVLGTYAVIAPAYASEGEVTQHRSMVLNTNYFYSVSAVAKRHIDELRQSLLCHGTINRQRCRGRHESTLESLGLQRALRGTVVLACHNSYLPALGTRESVVARENG